MSGSPVNEIISGYIEEVRTYIPSLKQGVESLKENPEQKEVINELHRLVHTIKGASLMVGIPGLSNIALQMENALSEIIDKKFEFNNEAGKLMAFTISRIEKYCDDILEGQVDSHAILKELIPAYRRFLGRPESEDEKAVKAVLEQVPEFEGGAESSQFEDLTDLSQESEDEIYDLPDDIDLQDMDTFSEPVKEPEQPPDIIPELLDSFYEEAKEHMEDLDSSLNILESQVKTPVDMSQAQKEIIRKIRRSVHTVKGAAAVIGLSNISSWGHAMEDFLDWLYEDTQTISPEIIELLMESGDLLAAIIASPSDPHASKCEHLKKNILKYLVIKPVLLNRSLKHLKLMSIQMSIQMI
ncbi:Hpt domain-containing protein [Desulfonema limicola]|uniref:Hpt domain-containing protein n=1 Tax=Desulfonema limicola TaxID=45656 RepID=A0A975GGL0_9BACT|nr:Hpt domain-containing protein [Desulfonema limicola]QTA80384.1 Hpt domain-containing protein [Desulfonema limicola]